MDFYDYLSLLPDTRVLIPGFDGIPDRKIVSVESWPPYELIDASVPLDASSSVFFDRFQCSSIPFRPLFRGGFYLEERREHGRVVDREEWRFGVWFLCLWFLV